MATSVGCHAFWFWVFWPFSYAQQLACWSVARSSGPKHTCTPKYNAPTRLTRFFFGFFFSSSWPRHNNDVWWCGNWDEDAVPPFTPLAICRCLYANLRPFFKLASFSDSDFNWLVQFAIGNASRMCTVAPSAWGRLAFGTCKPTALIPVYLGRQGPQRPTYSGTKWAGGMQFIWTSLSSNWYGQQQRNKQLELEERGLEMNISWTYLVPGK